MGRSLSKMATPGELVHTIAKVLGIAEATVVQIDRNLLAAGLRTKAGRGPSAAQVTSHDAANLLIAIGGAPITGASVKESRRTCERYRLLRAYGVQIKLGSFSRLKSQLPTLGRLPDKHSFGDAIAALIDSITAGEFGFPKDPLHYPHVSVRFDGPFPEGGIVVEFRGRRVQLSYQQTREPRRYESDFSQERRFGFATLSDVAKILHPEASARKEGLDKL
jgi:hypothetical protein